MNFVMDLAHHRVSVAQWCGIGARNPKVEVRFLLGTQFFSLCPTLVKRRKISFFY